MWTLVKMFLLTISILLLATIAEGYFDNTTDSFRPLENLNEKHFRREQRSRKEPRFLSFETKNNNIEVEIDFAIPFLSIPVKKSMDSVWNTANGLVQPLANVNLGAIVLAIMVAIAGAAFGGFSKFFQAGSNSGTSNSFFSFPNTGNSFGRG